ncbi:MAG: hypothetical protein L6R40_008222 [Gallowayella cf. fulva]|nr:MAG: hypothetical protein L6R40_008222 [Xanthomendoza cf. fulva]
MADPSRPGNQYRDIRIDQGAKAQLGDTYILRKLSHPIRKIDEQLFIGREDELVHLHEWLSPSTERQNVVAISGLGGMGKTQLSLHFARQYHRRYSAVIWLNASSEVTLRAAYMSLAQRIRCHNKQREAGQSEVAEQLKEEQAIQLVRQWLSQAENKTWLLIFDNYDDPRLPGIRSSTGYDIRTFFPYSTQGSILITTRSSRITFARSVRLNKFNDLNQSLAVLARRSGRQIQEDVDAKKLAERFDGLPLALATAGDYISQTADSFGEYLQMYEQSWDELAENSDGLMEYDDRTLYTTWNLSRKQVAAQDPQAVELFRLMGYLGNADLWYELFQNGAGSAPDWFCDITKSKARFNKAMATLHSYSLIEAMPGHYSLHACVHDWILGYLISKFDMALFGLAMHCIAQNVAWESMPEYWVINSRLNHHALRIDHCQQREVVDWNDINEEDMHCIGYLDNMIGRLKEAEAMYMRALKGYEKAWGAEHTSTLDTVNDLGSLYKNQGKMAEAEAMFMRALNGKEKAWGAEHTSTLDTVNNLAGLYKNQGKMADAEKMYMRALKGMEKAWGAEHTSTLDTVNNLGNLYSDQGKMAEAEQMYMRALKGYEKAWGAEHTSTLNTVNNLGSLYKNQGMMAEAEEMLLRALKGYEKAWGAEHTSTLRTVNNLGLLYYNQGKMAEAEEMLLRALKGFKKLYDADHPSVLHVTSNLSRLTSARN